MSIPLSPKMLTTSSPTTALPTPFILPRVQPTPYQMSSVPAHMRPPPSLLKRTSCLPIRTFADFKQTYTVLQKLGEGGYGSVHLASHKTTGAKVAVKMMQNERCHNRTFCPLRKRCLPNEIVFWEGLNHPNICRLLEVFFDVPRGTWILVSQYTPGYKDLFYHVDSTGPLSSQEAAHIIRQVVSAIHYLTLAGVDHRDLKDENLLYNLTTRHVRLIDFGSCGPLSFAPYTSFRGTDVYIPPEYFHTGAYLTLPAAVWTIGCLSYVLIAGDSPFQSRKEVQGFQGVEHLNKAYRERTIRLDFLRSCMEKDPRQRARLSDLLKHPWLANM